MHSSKDGLELAVIHRITIPKWAPARLNELMKNRWRCAALKKRDAALIVGYRMLQGIPKATGKRRVTLEITFGTGVRAGDPDAYNKSLLDALVNAGLLIGDTYNGVEVMPARYFRAEDTSTTIILEDI